MMRPVDIAHEPAAYIDWLIEYARSQPKQPEPVPIDDAIPRTWYVVVTELNRERSVCEDLARAGVEPYAPMKRWFRIGGGIVTRPLLTGYVFAGLPVGDGGFHALMAPRNSKSILPRPDAPQAIPTHEVDRLKIMEASGEFDQTARLSLSGRPAPVRASMAWIIPGAWIVVEKDSSFSGCLAMVKTVDQSRYRVTALIPMLGRKVVELRFYQFKAAS